MTTVTDRRAAMVETQIKARGIADPRILRAFLSVPRERFVSARDRELAYEDTPLAIEEGQTISQPYIVALMADAARIGPNDRVLEVGAGSGYACAILSRLAKDVRAIEWHASLALLAAVRLEALDIANAQVRQGDGTLGLPDEAPFDAIIVSAGGPDVPKALLTQLAIGGRLVIPVGTEPNTQELLKFVRTGPHQYDRASLGRVQFVPLVGTEGWACDAGPIGPHRARRPLRLGARETARLARLISDSCEEFTSVEHARLEPLVDRIGSARVVLLGESTHGTSEFYGLRARITEALIARAGFRIVALEADWPDAATIDRTVRREPPLPLRDPPFSRFPTWMWRNAEMQRFIDWIGRHNQSLPDPARRVRVHGLDLYSLNNSIGVVLDHLDRTDPSAASRARELYSCFTPWERDPAAYGRGAVAGTQRDCESVALATLREILEANMRLAADDEARFDAVRNATVVREAERYYRAMYRGARESWNLRDRHMFETLEALLARAGPDAKAVVWAHNSHVGNASATEMGMHGEINLGQLARERFGDGAYIVGFGTDHGTVAAAANWDAPMRVMPVRPSHEDSYERLCHESGRGMFMLPLRNPHFAPLRTELLHPRLERAIGVIYRPATELVSHYFQATLPAQFDEYIWIDETRAIEPLPTQRSEGTPETYPFAL